MEIRASNSALHPNNPKPFNRKLVKIRCHYVEAIIVVCTLLVCLDHSENRNKDRSIIYCVNSISQKLQYFTAIVSITKTAIGISLHQFPI